MAVALAFASAALFALGSVLQQREAMTESDAEAQSAAILIKLARHPVWLAGIATYTVAYGLQAAALGVGKLVVVQPILATTIVFALPLGARLSGQRISVQQIVWALIVTGGLGLFLVLSDPAGGRDDAPIGAWLLAGGAVAVVAGALALAGMRRDGAIRAALVGTAAGLLFGLVSALTKSTVGLLDEGVLEIVTDWHLYALLLVGFGGMTLIQISFQAGVLPPAVATSSIFNPACSVLLGVVLFQETIHESALASVASLLALLAMFGGVAILALRSDSPDGSRPAVAS